MPCCAILLILALGPRVAILVIALLSDYMGRAFGGSLLLPLIGWLFLPWTTLAYAWAVNSGEGVAGFHLVVLIVAVLVDLGGIGGAAKRRKKSS